MKPALMTFTRGRDMPEATFIGPKYVVALPCRLRQVRRRNLSQALTYSEHTAERTQNAQSRKLISLMQLVRAAKEPRCHHIIGMEEKREMKFGFL